MCLFRPQGAFRCFEENTVVIPVTVLEELDNLKRDDGERGINARKAIRALEQLRVRGLLTDGVEMENGGLLRVEKNYVDVQLPQDFHEHKQDNRILKVCKGLAEDLSQPVILVTKDMLLRIKAQLLGLAAEDFTTEQVAEEEIQYRGRAEVYVPEDAFKDFKKKGCVG